MNKNKKSKAVYNFENTCENCLNNFQCPVLGSFAYGETIFQTVDGRDYFLACLIDNKTLNFIHNLLHTRDFLKKEINSQKILAFLADKIEGTELTSNYPICPICKFHQRTYNDIKQTTKREINYASWNEFERLIYDDKIKKIEEAISMLK